MMRTLPSGRSKLARTGHQLPRPLLESETVGKVIGQSWVKLTGCGSSAKGKEGSLNLLHELGLTRFVR